MLRYLAPLAILVFIGVFFYFGLQRNPNDVPSALIGKTIPTFSLPSVTDPQKLVTSEPLAGHVSLVNVWGSWCVE